MTEKFMALLDEQYTWPSPYTFKFIVRPEQVVEVRDILSEAKIEEKQSRTGKFVSLTCVQSMSSSDEVVKMYEKAGQISGLISL
jgi:hypothetical protein